MLDADSPAISLKRRVLGASFWSLAVFAVSYTIRLGSSMLMTRLLVPEMFGVMAIAMMVMTGLAMFSNVGLRPTIVQNARGNDPAFLNTAWAVQIIRGFLLWFLAVCVALLIFAASQLDLVPAASVYADPLLPPVIAIVSVSAAIGGFQSTKVSEASRYLRLARVTQMQIAAQVAGLVCMLSWALIERSIWALVAGTICAAVATTLLSHIWLPGVANRWHWDRSAFDEIFNFGKWMLLSSILGFFANSTDRMLLGGFVDSATLGVYSIAFTVFSSIVQILNKLIADVSYSALSEVARERSHDLKRSLYRFHVFAASFAYFCAGGLIVFGHTLIVLLYDPRYEQAGWMLEVLAVGLVAVPFNLAIYTMLARGLAKIFTGLIAIRVAAAVVLIPLGFHYFGIAGAMWGIVASQLSMLPGTIYCQIKYDLFDLPKELMPLPALVVGMLVATGLKFAVGHLMAL